MIGFLMQLLVVLLLLSVIYWLVSAFAPPPFLRIAQVVLAIVLILWLLSALGVFGGWYPYRAHWG